MQEFEQKILEQYDIEVNSTRKVRGAVLCETNKGVFLLKEVTTSEKRIPGLFYVAFTACIPFFQHNIPPFHEFQKTIR